MKPKIAWTKKQQLDHWIQSYLQAKTDGNARLMQIYRDLIIKLGGQVPKL